VKKPQNKIRTPMSANSV